MRLLLAIFSSVWATATGAAQARVASKAVQTVRELSMSSSFAAVTGTANLAPKGREHIAPTMMNLRSGRALSMINGTAQENASVK